MTELREALRRKLTQGGLVLAVGGPSGPLFPLRDQTLTDVLDILVGAVVDAQAIPVVIDDEPTQPYPAHVAAAMPKLSKVIINWSYLVAPEG